ncbi:MAG: T9SS type A sorting domain-containing protein [Melioribacteraceae bacterium]|nr:T9SS type A sorting domain-containing protein [Melioribacteraceae bacterium]
MANDLYYLDVTTNEETLIQSGIWEGPGNTAYFKGTTTSRILDFNTTTNKLSYIFIYKNLEDSLVELRTQIEDSTFAHFSDSLSFIKIFLVNDKNTIFVSYQNWNTDSYGLLKSVDMGRSWEIQEYPNISIFPIAISPYDSNSIFGVNSAKNLVKSENGGSSFSIVEEENSWQSYSSIKFDADEASVYALNTKSLLVSKNKGDSWSWQTKYELPVLTWGNMLLYLEVDKANSGTVYFAGNDNNIWKSSDFGENYFLFSQTKKAKFYGEIYFASSSNKLFVANKNIISVISESSNILLRAIKQDNSIALYPLAVGNKWVLKGSKHWDGVYSESILATIEIVKDTLLPNNKIYFQIERNGSMQFESGFERVDSLGFVYCYDTTYTYGEYIVEDLTLFSRAIDTLNVGTTEIQKFCNLISEQEYFSEMFSTKTFEASYFHDSFTYNFSTNIGLTSIYDNWDFGYSDLELKGAIINGILYGDTTVVGVKENKLSLSYNLEQNYPNPFNPTTKISYSILSDGFVTIKLYDIIGNEVYTLVNERMRSGKHEINFDGKNLTSGVYFYRIIANDFSDTKKMLLLK